MSYSISTLHRVSVSRKCDYLGAIRNGKRDEDMREVPSSRGDGCGIDDWGLHGSNLHISKIRQAGLTVSS